MGSILFQGHKSNIIHMHHDDMMESVNILIFQYAEKIKYFFSVEKKNVIPFYCILMAIRSFSEKKYVSTQ